MLKIGVKAAHLEVNRSVFLLKGVKRQLRCVERWIVINIKRNVVAFGVLQCKEHKAVATHVGYEPPGGDAFFCIHRNACGGMFIGGKEAFDRCGVTSGSGQRCLHYGLLRIEWRVERAGAHRGACWHEKSDRHANHEEERAHPRRPSDDCVPWCCGVRTVGRDTGSVQLHAVSVSPSAMDSVPRSPAAL